jgi:hypothetical protein
MPKPRPSELYFGPAEITDPSQSTPACEEPQHEPEPTSAQADDDWGEDEDAYEDFVTRVTRNRNLSEDIAAGVHWNGGQSLFLSVDDKIRDALSPAYVVYLHLLNNPASWEEVLRHPPFDARQRQPKEGTEAVVAVTLVAKPRDEDEQKTCSEYATALIWAELTEVRPEHFAEKVASEGLKNCRDFVRRVRRGLRGTTKTTRRTSARSATGEVVQQLSADDAAAQLVEEETEAAAVNPVIETSALDEAPKLTTRPVPVTEAFKPDSDVQTDAGDPTLTIAVINAVGNSRSVSISLSQEEAEAAIAILDRERFHSALHALGTVMKVLDRPERAHRNVQKRRSRQLSLVK